MIHTSRRIQTLNTHYFAMLEEKLSLFQKGASDIIRLDVGTPDMPPASHIIETLCNAAIRPDAHGYQNTRGTPALNQAWAEMYRRVYSVHLDPEREVLPLMGSKEGIFNLIQAYIEPGDVVLVPDPGYMTYRRATLFAGGEPYPMPLLPERGFLPDLQAIPRDVIRRAKLLWLNYPSNPTAATASVGFLTEAVEFARHNGLLLCHDAAYSQVTFNGYTAPSILAVPGARDVSLEVNSLSKSHNMAGWRVGAALGNAQAINALYRVKANADNGQFLPILEAAVTALTGEQDWIRVRNEIYRQRRDVVVQALHEVGLACTLPKASLYVWFAIPIGWTSAAFTDLLLEKALVSLAPGTVFGERGEGYIRLAFTKPLDLVAEAMRRVVSVIGGL
jgi:LL-diaminopimelate aminotransferase